MEEIVVEICGIISKNRVSLKGHVRYIHGIKKYSCNICNRKFGRPYALRQHVENSHGTTPRSRYPCKFPGCGKSFLNKSTECTHFRREHVQNPVRFLCQLCGIEFKRKEHLTNHVSTHTTEKTYKCAHCGKGFIQRGALKIHVKTHIDRCSRPVLTCHLCP
ncbi:zinc finger protein 177 [Folsomia candida]|uniref:zinc finger protein 177 n=1 Tax=Folsomia candida TaxID=158441 RepID=UPI001605045B|nr:zinc finger protein 177 [Folsomia candida]